MDNKEFAIRIGRFSAGSKECGVPVRAVEGGLACDGSGSALGSPGVVALIGYPHRLPLSLQPAPGPISMPKKQKRRKSNSSCKRIWHKSRQMQASRNTRQGFERGHGPRRHVGVYCVASRHMNRPLNGPDCQVKAGRPQTP